MLRVSLVSLSTSRLAARTSGSYFGSSAMETTLEIGIRQTSSTSPRRECPTVEKDELPRKKSRKSTIMEALRRGASLAQEQVANGEGSRQLSTIASMATGALSMTPTPLSIPLPPSPAPLPSPTAPSDVPRLAPTGLPFYTHTESIESAGLPPIPASNVHYFRYGPENRSAPDDVNLAITRMINNLNSPPGSRWQGVVGFDMEWTVPYSKGRMKNGLIQLSDEKNILLIQISSMKFMPIKLKAIITSPTILKVGVNIGNDMRRIYQEFGIEYAGRGILDLSYLAKAADVGLVGTRVGDLDSSQAHVGIGIKKDQVLVSTSSVEDVMDENDPDKEGGMLDSETTISIENPPSSTSRGIDPADKLVRKGRVLVQLARLCRRYLQRELEKGDERTSNWDVKLSKEQRQYAANDVHAGLAIYHALRATHSQSIAAGLIPVPGPAPWEETSTSKTNPVQISPSLTESLAPTPFRPKTVPAKPPPEPEVRFVPVDQLQNLNPTQLESLLPWSTLVSDMRADMDATRAAVQAKRAKEGVDICGKGEAVVEAEAAAKAAAAAKPANPSDSVQDTSASATTVLNNGSSLSLADGAILQDNYATIPSKGMERVLERRRATEKSSEVMGKKWPPTRVTAPRILEATCSSSIPAAETRPAPPASSSAPTPTKPSPAQLRAYLLWHNRKLPLAQICGMMRSNKYPLEKHIVVTHIVETLRLDPSLPFDATQLKLLVGTSNLVKEEYKAFLADKLGAPS